MYLLSRLAQLVLMLLAFSLGAFALLDAMPGDPIAAQIDADPRITRADADRMRRLAGLDRPWPERWGCWVAGRSEGRCEWWPGAGLLAGDLGYSRAHRRPASELIGERLANTFAISAPALLLALLGALLLGTRSALAGGEGVRALAIAGAAIPAHWLALLAILIFAVGLGWLPPSGVEDPRAPGLAGRLVHGVLPVSVLGFFFFAHWARHTRAAVLEVLELPHVRAARARGLGERELILRHVLRNAAVPIVSVVAQSIPALFSGSVVIERAFSYPGMGLLVVESVEHADHVVAMGALVLLAALTMGATLLADLSYFALDPRIRRRP